ncbi:KOW domain-containing protein [Clostridium formicaceticum]|uniref:50S ribosomal protein L14 n=1 Tax=Clostridium formicaceticum TaxID=1497 RepID=A0AAC9WHZ3_9CLOT|nr:KOW domain-containing protein [Clostridium formicaceticum]AOY75082.1 50S ribosomal protein L14 [Clostridium formicaceticum]ARE89506.1 50S ribosomal protein L14e [Clostridium formicaceticum]
MEQSDINIGQVVKSTQGRDKGKFFIVLDKVDKEYVLIVDGDIRKTDKPKKKKLKHLVKLSIISAETKDRIVSNKKITNAFIRRELERLGVNA